jgi:hypothetical protein
MRKNIYSFQCNTCKQYYASYQSLWIHNKKVHNSDVIILSNNVNNMSNKYTCEYCNKIFNSRQSKWCIIKYLNKRIILQKIKMK